MSEIVKDPEILGGMPVFVGTRVPVKNLFDALIGGDSISEFLDDFPTVTFEQVQSVLSEAEHAIGKPGCRVKTRRVIIDECLPRKLKRPFPATSMYSSPSTRTSNISKIWWGSLSGS